MSLIEIIGVLGGAGLFGLVGTIIGWLVTRNKTLAETEKMIAETEQIRIEANLSMQKQLDGLRDANHKLFEERELEREAKDKLRSELNRLHEDIELIRRELHIERQRNNLLLNELDSQRASNSEKRIRINNLETLVQEQKQAIEKNGVDINAIKRKTGQLPPMPDHREGT